MIDLQFLLPLVHAVSTWTMFGVIWTVQAVHYPLFSKVGSQAFPAYEADHVRRISWIVAPAMLLESASALAMLGFRPASLPVGLVWAGLALLAVIWASTALLQVPQHNRLARGFDAEAHRRLVLSNWVRTVAWSLRAALALAMLAALLTG